MSWPHIELLMKTRDLWTHPGQFAVMNILGYKDGYAEASAPEIAALIGVSVRRVRQIYEELEAMDACERKGPEHDGGRQRFIITIERAIAKKRAADEGRGGSVLHPPPVLVDAATAEAGFRGGGSVLQGEGGNTDQGGRKLASSPVPGDLSDRSRGTEAAAQSAAAAHSPAQNNLPFLPARPAYPNEQAAKAARDIRLKKLRYKVAGLARAILMNPALGRELLEGEDVGNAIERLEDATEALCRRKRVRGFEDVVRGQCASEFFKWRHADVIAGRAPRPRDLRTNPYETTRGTLRKRGGPMR